VLAAGCEQQQQALDVAPHRPPASIPQRVAKLAVPRHGDAGAQRLHNQRKCRVRGDGLGLVGQLHVETKKALGYSHRGTPV